MTTVNLGVGISDPTHDLSLSDSTTTLGMIFAGGPRVLTETPLSPPAQQFENEQRNWIGGRGRDRYVDDPTGFFDSLSLWSTSDGRLMPMLQWRFAKGIRDNDTSLPGFNATMAWWKLYGNTPASKIARYLTIPFVASASYSLSKGYLWIRRRGSPGTLTFELNADGTGKPGGILKAVSKTTTNITDTVSIFQLFALTSAQSVVSGTTYYLKIYGAGTDDANNHWEVLGNSGGTSSLYSSDGTNWSTASISMYYRVTDADINRQWKFFNLLGALYAVSINDDGSTSVLKTNGVRGVVSSATSTTLTCSALTMTTNQHILAYLWIIEGTGDGQVRQVTSNTATEFTVPAWDITPDTTSSFILIAADWWTATTGTSGLGAVKGKPVNTGSIAYFPQGQAVNIRRMRVNTNSHDFDADGTNKADLMHVNVEGTAPIVYAANAASATIQPAPVVGWGTNLTLGAARSIGDFSRRITNMFSYNKVMKIFKEDGVYSYNNGIVEKEGENFEGIPDPTMGLGVATQNNFLWFGWAHSVERMLGSNVDDMLNFKNGYNGVPENEGGYISCIVSAIGWLFFVVDGGATTRGWGSANYSSIWCWNGMGWHKIFRAWAPGVRIRNAFWQGNAEAKGRLWFDVGGDMVYIEFPQFAANPLKDTVINYQPEGVIVTSTYDAHDANLYKILQTLRVFMESGSVEVDYQTNANVGTNTWTVLGTASTLPVTDLALNLGGVFQVRFRFRLQTTSSLSPAILTGWQLSGRQMPLPLYQFLATFKTDSDQTTFTDEPDTDPNTLYSQLQTWAIQQTKLVLRTNSNSSDNKIVTISLPSKSVDWIDSGESKWGGRISLAILQVS